RLEHLRRPLLAGRLHQQVAKLRDRRDPHVAGPPLQHAGDELPINIRVEISHQPPPIRFSSTDTYDENRAASTPFGSVCSICCSANVCGDGGATAVDRLNASRCARISSCW